MRVTVKAADQLTSRQQVDLGLFLGEFLFATPGGSDVSARMDGETSVRTLEVVFDHDYVDARDLADAVERLRRSFDVDVEINEYFLRTESEGRKAHA